MSIYSPSVCYVQRSFLEQRDVVVSVVTHIVRGAGVLRPLGQVQRGDDPGSARDSGVTGNKVIVGNGFFVLTTAVIRCRRYSRRISRRSTQWLPMIFCLQDTAMIVWESYNIQLLPSNKSKIPVSSF